ncbi:MAG: YncE family protein [Candidatus Fermentibacteria bacterium]
MYKESDVLVEVAWIAVSTICTLIMFSCGSEPTDPDWWETPPPPDSIAMSIQVGDYPWGACILPSGEYVYVANQNDGTVSVIDVSTDTVSNTIDIGSNGYGTAVTPTGDLVFISHGSTVSVIETSSQQKTNEIPSGGSGARAMSMLPPYGEYLYVTNYQSQTVGVIRTSDQTLVDTIGVGVWPEGITCDPTGSYVYVVNSGSGSNPDGSISVIDASSNTVIHTIESIDGSPGIAHSDVGHTLYVGNFHWNSIFVINTYDFDFTITDTIPVAASPLNIRHSPWDDFLFVACGSGQAVDIIDTSSRSVVSSVPMGDRPFGIAFSPQETRVYVACRDNDVVNVLE